MEMVLLKKDQFILIFNIALKWLNGTLAKRQTLIAKNNFEFGNGCVLQYGI